MGSKFKSVGQGIKLEQSSRVEKDVYPSFSLRYLTDDEKYRFEKFDKQPKDKMLAYDGLYKLIRDLGHTTVRTWLT